MEGVVPFLLKKSVSKPISAISIAIRCSPKSKNEKSQSEFAKAIPTLAIISPRVTFDSSSVLQSTTSIED